ncbi:mitochondrial substrate carrier family protein [Acrasis kona]|uniref:Mitochondrial substrate carrier family protein n=1 Tax=Acrasis kona TaxID=1008807 RepID=A0AAW2ZAB2_9EUKA
MSGHTTQVVDHRSARRHEENRNVTKILLKFLAGGTSASGVSAMMNSCDFAKTRLQIQQATTGVPKYKNFPQAYSTILREEGLRTLLGRGLAASMVREMTYSSVRMGMYDPVKALFTKSTEGDPGLFIKIMSGGIAGAVGSFVANPADLVKIRQMAVLPGETTPYRNCFHAGALIYMNEGGIKGLYRGVTLTVVRASVLTAAQLSTYDHTKHILIHKTSVFEDNIYTHLLSSLVAGFCTTVASSPFDVIKTRYMNSPTGFYKNAFDCFLKTFRNEGPRSLYKGFAPNYLRLGAHCMFALPLYEQVRLLLGLTTM